MKLVKTCVIEAVHATGAYNAPYAFLLRQIDAQFYSQEDIHIVLDKEACERHALVPSLKLVGRQIQCTLTARQLGEKSCGFRHGKESFVNMEERDIDDVPLVDIRRLEIWSANYGVGFDNDQLWHEVSYTFRVETPQDTYHLCETPCPLYQLLFYLTEEEFEEWKKMPRYNVLRVSLALLPPVPLAESE